MARKTRVRLEFTALLKGAGAGYALDRKLGSLRILLRERFKEPGLMAFEGWLAEVAQEQRDRDSERRRHA